MTPDAITLEVDGLKFHVSAWGASDKPVVFLLHGMRDNSRSWDWVANALAHRYRVYAPDLRGHGDSDWADGGAYALPNFVLDVDDVACALGTSEFSVVGHSFGGAIGLRYVATFGSKVRGFVGIECVELPINREQQASPKTYPEQLREWAIRERHRRSRPLRYYPSLDVAQRRMHDEHPRLDEETVAHLVRHAMTLNTAHGWRWKYDNAARHRAPDDADGVTLDQMLDAITCPVMLAYGTASWIPLPDDARLARIKHLSLKMFPGESHWLHHTAREAFISEIQQFLSTLPERPNHA